MCRRLAALGFLAGFLLSTDVSAQASATQVFKVGDDPSGIEFGRIADVVQDPTTGRVYVADAMSRSVSILGEDGSFLGAFGRPGEGPGEFPNPPTGLAIHEGTLIVTDHGLLQRFSLDGEYIDRVPFVPEQRISAIVSIDSGPGFLLVGTREIAGRDQYRMTYSVSPEGTTPVDRLPFRGGAVKGERSYWGLAGGTGLVTDPESSSVVLTDLRGGDTARVVVRDGVREHTRSDVQALREYFGSPCEALPSARVAECRDTIAATIDRLDDRRGEPVTSTGPVVGASDERWVLALADGPGDLTAQTFSEFSVFDGERRIVQRLRVATPVTPKSFSGGVIWGVAFGPYDEPLVVGYRLAAR
jgi:hypothetical protein